MSDTNYNARQSILCVKTCLEGIFNEMSLVSGAKVQKNNIDNTTIWTNKQFPERPKKTKQNLTL